MDESKGEQFNIRFLFVVTTTCAIAAWLISRHDLLPLQRAGVGILLFWLATGLFATCKGRNPTILWPGFIFGFILYLFSINLMLSGVLFFVGDVWTRLISNE